MSEISNSNLERKVDYELAQGLALLLVLRLAIGATLAAL